MIEPRPRRASLVVLSAAIALTAGCGSAEGTDGPGRRGEVAWDRAASHEGTKTTVCGPLRGTGGTEDATFLNLGVDYPDPDRFTIVIWEAVPQRSWSVGSRVCAVGRVDAFEDIHEMQFDTLDAFEARSSVR